MNVYIAITNAYAHLLSPKPLMKVHIQNEISFRGPAVRRTPITRVMDQASFSIAPPRRSTLPPLSRFLPVTQPSPTTLPTLPPSAPLSPGPRPRAPPLDRARASGPGPGPRAPRPGRGPRPQAWGPGPWPTPPRLLHPPSVVQSLGSLGAVLGRLGVPETFSKPAGRPGVPLAANRFEKCNASGLFRR